MGILSGLTKSISHSKDPTQADKNRTSKRNDSSFDVLRSQGMGVKPCMWYTSTFAAAPTGLTPLIELQMDYAMPSKLQNPSPDESIPGSSVYFSHLEAWDT